MVKTARFFLTGNLCKIGQENFGATHRTVYEISAQTAWMLGTSVEYQNQIATP